MKYPYVSTACLRKAKSRDAGILNGSEGPAGFSHTENKVFYTENKVFYTFLGVLRNQVLYAMNAIIVCTVVVPRNPINR